MLFAVWRQVWPQVVLAMVQGIMVCLVKLVNRDKRQQIVMVLVDRLHRRLSLVCQCIGLAMKVAEQVLVHSQQCNLQLLRL